MFTTGLAEACIEDAGNILVAPSALHDDDSIKDFFGSVITPEDFASGSFDLAHKSVYLCGDVSEVGGRRLHAAGRVFVIRGLAHGYHEDVDKAWSIVDLGQVPVRVHGVGVYYRRFFDLDADHFGRICAEHAFQ
ncbi:hypothetical protein ACFHW2_18825 [Actinomadura sp. LOL_016]|uniref:hypothetical protein n=1 Tax=unclassified Actinomadura TaxID=2626254 RepID=UPI003A80C1E7